MAFTFKLFEPKRKRTSKAGHPVVEVKPTGRIFFNKQASVLLENNRFCMLGYDQENGAVGVLPLNEGQENCIPVRYTAKGAYIGAKKILRHFGILPEAKLANQPIQDGKFIAIRL